VLPGWSPCTWACCLIIFQTVFSTPLRRFQARDHRTRASHATGESTRSHGVTPQTVRLNLMQHPHHDINNSYQCRLTTGELILVFNSGQYLMAEYNSRTGHVTWQRMLAAPQRDSIEAWLHKNYPIKDAAVVLPNVRINKRKIRT
jgi:hypothetical protein